MTYNFEPSIKYNSFFFIKIQIGTLEAEGSSKKKLVDFSTFFLLFRYNISLPIKKLNSFVYLKTNVIVNFQISNKIFIFLIQVK